MSTFHKKIDISSVRFRGRVVSFWRSKNNSIHLAGLCSIHKSPLKNDSIPNRNRYSETKHQTNLLDMNL